MVGGTGGGGGGGLGAPLFDVEDGVAFWADGSTAFDEVPAA